MRIEIWSDVVCPWCYVGKRRLEKALARFPHADRVSLGWRSFQLDPGAPSAPTESNEEHLGRKYGGGAAAGRQMIARMEAVAAEEGLPFRLAEASPVNTFDAHRLLHAAGARQDDLKEALLAAYFLHARNVADHRVLREVAVGAGLDEMLVAEVLAGDRFADAVEADIRQAAAYGATGVPFFVVDDRYGISGAQPVEVFAQVLDRAWGASRPSLSLVAGEADACGPDGCPV